MPKDSSKKSKKMRGGVKFEKVDIPTDLTDGVLKTAVLDLNSSIKDDDVEYNYKDLKAIVEKLLAVLNILAAEEAETPSAAAGGSRKKKHSKTVKRGGGDVLDMSKLYNVSGLIVDTKDPVGVAGGIGQDSTPMPFSANGQGIRYTGGIAKEFMNDLNPSQGVSGGAKKKTKGKK